MLIRALKTTSGSYGTLPRGGVSDVPEYEARDLISHGYAIEELPLAKQEAVPANDNIPLAEGRTGGQIGANVPQSLSPVDRVQPTLTSEQSGDAETAGSSPSTTDTNSPHGQTSSTPAITTGGKRKRGRPSSKG